MPDPKSLQGSRLAGFFTIYFMKLISISVDKLYIWNFKLFFGNIKFLILIIISKKNHAGTVLAIGGGIAPSLTLELT
ncbi:MAG: hypothetical protein M3Y65_12405 [Pseudomonadota bacterium]|nr:hypothetical protein [Pseudomonadota bacterium]